MIHKYCQNGTYMLLDVNSGIINVIDKMTYDVLDVLTVPIKTLSIRPLRDV